MSMFVIYAEIVHLRSYGGWNIEMGYTQTLFSSLCFSGTMLKQRQGSRQVSRERATYFPSIVRHTNAEQGNH